MVVTSGVGSLGAVQPNEGGSNGCDRTGLNSMFLYIDIYIYIHCIY